MKNTILFFAISLATILSASLILMGEIPQAIAENDDKDKSDAQTTEESERRFAKKPSFVSDQCIVTDFAKNNLSQESLDLLDCKMRAWLDNKGTALKYKINISGMQLIDDNGSTADDVNQLHIHKNTLGTQDNPQGPHQLNVFREPNFDDSDVFIKPVQGVIQGIWTDEDENLSYGEPDNSHTLTENLALLCDSQIFSAAHGDVEDRPGHKAPYFKMLLEPTKEGEKICKKLGFE
ncbi:MAG: hypothetical protein OEX98_01220 [Nitrosopumilus sp.]|nr:hypothetical protein [Nitrosopumilus sp.]